jgi:hypothetical protein
MNPTQALRMARINAASRCPQCATYAWGVTTMDPVYIHGAGWHHPACVRVTGPRPMPRGVVRAMAVANPRALGGVGAPFIVTPADTLAYMDRVNTKILYLGEDFTQALGDGAQPKKADYDKAAMNPQFIKDSIEWRAKQPDILKQWWVFEAEWKAHYADNASGVGAWFARGTSGAYEEIAKWDIQADKWTKVFESKTGKKPKQVVSSTPTDEEEDRLV